MVKDKKNWKEIRSQVKDFVENEVYPAEKILSKRDDERKKY